MVLGRLARLAAAQLADGDDPEAVGAERLEAQLQVGDVPRDAPPLLPRPLVLLRVLLLPSLHQEL